MYDINPFIDAKRYFEEAKARKQTVASKKSKTQTQADLDKKRKFHMAMVKKGEMTQAEFERLEVKGEFEMKESYGSLEEGDEQGPLSNPLVPPLEPGWWYTPNGIEEIPPGFPGSKQHGPPLPSDIESYPGYYPPPVGAPTEGPLRAAYRRLRPKGTFPTLGPIWPDTTWEEGVNPHYMPPNWWPTDGSWGRKPVGWKHGGENWRLPGVLRTPRLLVDPVYNQTQY